MRRPTSLLTAEQRQQIEDAVAAAESQTSCEIVPVVAAVSGRYDRSVDIIGLWFAIGSMVAIWLLFPRPKNDIGSWGEPPVYIGILAIVAALPLVFIAGAFLGSRIRWLRLLFIPRHQLRDEVAARARTVFFDKRVHHTQGATGLLIYVSLFEHVAVVLGDQEVLTKMGQPFLDRLRDRIIEELRKGSLSQAMCCVISEAGKHLPGPLPRTADDKNEIANALIMID